MIKPIKKNYTPTSSGFWEGFLGAKYDIGFYMVADYTKAKYIIKYKLLDKRKIKNVKMGLDGDWECNSNIIYNSKGFYKYKYTKVSLWAKPIIIIYYENGENEMYEVWEKYNKEDIDPWEFM